MRKLWFELRSSLWFVPSVLVLIAIVLGIGLVELDAAFADRLKPWGWMTFLKTGAAGARGMLEAIAGSMITVAGLAFSITIVTLSLASTQYTPRILRNFMRDRANQAVLGVFVGIYAYCLIVLRTIRDSNDAVGGFVPVLAVSFGVLLALVGIGFLIFFIHHTATSIQASSILDSITRETLRTIEKLFPHPPDESAVTSPGIASPDAGPWHAISAKTSGYLQSLDGDGLWKFAVAENLVTRPEREVGDFVVEGMPLISSTRPLEALTADRLRDFFIIGSFRTVDQDVGFGIRQIVDIALKALSPAVNGTTTAVACLDYLSVILSSLAGCDLTSVYRRDGAVARVVAPDPQFSEYVAHSLDEIRLCTGDNVTLVLALLSLIGRVAYATRHPDRRSVLREHFSFIIQLADSSIHLPYDRRRINHRIEMVRRRLDADETSIPLLHI